MLADGSNSGWIVWLVFIALTIMHLAANQAERRQSARRRAPNGGGILLVGQQTIAYSSRNVHENKGAKLRLFTSSLQTKESY